MHPFLLTLDVSDNFFVKVSPTYAAEVAGNGVIAPHLHKFHGIRNGIDPEIWDPYTDPFIPVSLNLSCIIQGLNNEAICASLNAKICIEWRDKFSSWIERCRQVLNNFRN